jgi:predicted small metal-binding protein
MARKIADCRRWPSESNCSLTIIGEEDEVIRTAAEHAVSVHGHEDSPELREQIREFLEPEESYIQGTREKEPMPG